MPKDRILSARNHGESEELTTVTNSSDGKDSPVLLSSLRMSIWGSDLRAGLSTATKN